MRSRIAVLTYHSMNIGGNDYWNNDHIAFEEDINYLVRAGIPIIPLRHVAACIAENKQLPFGVSLSCDDGSWFDWYELDHPHWGVQKSMRLILHETAPENQRYLTSFVIASPFARSELDRTCMIGCGWWGDEWWSDAAKSGIDIQNHSWDHNHSTLKETVVGDAARGRFDVIEDDRAADAEIVRASNYIRSRTGGAAELFAFPYGESNAFLVEDYLPRCGPANGLTGAFTTEPRPVETASKRWALPRFVCGAHWKSPDDLRRLLADALNRSSF